MLLVLIYYSRGTLTKEFRKGEDVRVSGIPLFVRVIEKGSKWPKDCLFRTTKFEVPIFGTIAVSCNGTIFRKNGVDIDYGERDRILQPYILKPTSPGPQTPEKALIEFLTPTFLEGLWIRVWGGLETMQLEGDDVIEDLEKAEHLIGDMDMPITGLASWAFIINAETIDLEIKPSPYYPGI